jgi:hypothetical protein
MGNCFSSKPSEKEKDFDSLSSNINYKRNIALIQNSNITHSNASGQPRSTSIVLNNVNNMGKPKYTRQNSTFTGSESTTTTTANTNTHFGTEDQLSSNVSRSTASGNSVSLTASSSGVSSTNSNNLVNITKVKNAYVALYDYDKRTNQVRI